MKLVIFDIDGTLTDSTAVDDYCFELTVKNLWNRKVDVDWNKVPHVTDHSITHFVFQELFNEELTPEGYDEFKSAFLHNLENQSVQNPEKFKMITGGQAMLHRLISSPDYCIAFGTGSWAKSGEIKLSTAGYDYDQYPMGNSDLAHTRVNVALKAKSLSEEKYDVKFEKVIYFGDGLWDQKCTTELQWPFVGVDFHQNQKLKNNGASFVIQDYTDLESILNFLKLN